MKSLIAFSLVYCIKQNRFHVAVHLFSNRSQMTSKRGKNKKVAHEPLGECVTDVLTKFGCRLRSIIDLAQQGGWKTQRGKISENVAQERERTISRDIFASFCRPEPSNRPVA